MNLFDAFRIPSMMETDRYLLEVHKEGLSHCIDVLELYCNDVIAKCNIIENRKNLREAMTADERLDVMLLRQKVEAFLAEIKRMKSI